MGISRIGQTNGMDYISAINNCKNNIPQSRFPSSSHDTIAISDEAMEMYFASKSGSHSQDAELKTTLTGWFNKVFGVSGGSGAAMPSDVQEKDRSSWPPENLELYKQLEAEVDAADTEKHTVLKSKEVREKLGVLTQKLNVLDALGDKMVVTESIMEKATAILDKLYSDWKDEHGWSKPDRLSSIDEEVGRKRDSNTSSKSVFSMLLESLFLAELEESGAVGGNEAKAAGNEKQTNEDEMSRAQPKKTTSASPLKDGDKVAQIKKVLTDFTKGKADLTDISTAIGGGKGVSQSEGASSAAKSNESKESKII